MPAAQGNRIHLPPCHKISAPGGTHCGGAAGRQRSRTHVTRASTVAAATRWPLAKQVARSQKYAAPAARALPELPLQQLQLDGRSRKKSRNHKQYAAPEKIARALPELLLWQLRRDDCALSKSRNHISIAAPAARASLELPLRQLRRDDCARVVRELRSLAPLALDRWVHRDRDLARPELALAPAAHDLARPR